MEVTNYLLTGMTLQILSIRANFDLHPAPVGSVSYGFFMLGQERWAFWNSCPKMTETFRFRNYIGGGNSNIFGIFILNLGEMESNLTVRANIFQMGGKLNHQLVIVICPR